MNVVLVLYDNLHLWYFPAALQSVFPQTELAAFLSLSKKEKDRQLKELTMIVTGIRLFNKDCGKGGEGIDDCRYICGQVGGSAYSY